MDYQRRIHDLREDHDKTQQEIAEILGTSQTMYARYERGVNELPIRHLIRLADYYGVSTDYILGQQDGAGRNLWDTAKKRPLNCVFVRGSGAWWFLWRVIIIAGLAPLPARRA